MKESLKLLNNLFAYTHVLITFIFDTFHYVAGSHIGYMYRVYIYIYSLLLTSAILCFKIIICFCTRTYTYLNFLLLAIYRVSYKFSCITVASLLLKRMMYLEVNVTRCEL